MKILRRYYLKIYNFINIKYGYLPMQKVTNSINELTINKLWLF